MASQISVIFGSDISLPHAHQFWEYENSVCKMSWPFCPNFNVLKWFLVSQWRFMCPLNTWNGSQSYQKSLRHTKVLNVSHSLRHGVCHLIYKKIYWHFVSVFFNYLMKVFLRTYLTYNIVCCSPPFLTIWQHLHISNWLTNKYWWVWRSQLMFSV